MNEKHLKLSGNPCSKESGFESVLEVEVRYQKDAYVGFPRGYYLHVSPIGIKRENGYYVRSFTIGAGPKSTRRLLLEVKRRTSKGDAEAARLGAELESAVVAAVLAGNGLTLAVAQGAAFDEVDSGAARDAIAAALRAAGEAV
jgi:hypothetical protein